MGKAINRGDESKHTYTTYPDVLMGKKQISLQARVILSKILNLWKNCKKVTISNERLSQFIGLDERSVRRAKSDLVKEGLIEVVQEEKGRGHLATIQVNEKKVNEFLGYNFFHVNDDMETNDEPSEGGKLSKQMMKRLNKNKN